MQPRDDRGEIQYFHMAEGELTIQDGHVGKSGEPWKSDGELFR